MSDVNSNPSNTNNMQHRNGDDLADINVKLDAILASIGATRQEVTEYMSTNDKKVDGISERVDTNAAKVAALESRLSALEVAKPSDVAFTLERELLKQQQLKESVCLHGIPQKNNENLRDIVKAVGAALKIRIGSNDIVKVHRTKPSKKSPGLIIIKLSSFDKKIEVMDAKKSISNLVVANLNLKLDQILVLSVV